MVLNIDFINFCNVINGNIFYYLRYYKIIIVVCIIITKEADYTYQTNINYLWFSAFQNILN